ncbi:hypothetical protein [Pseudobutyrivibrio ruminis]|uniref:Uncharacterized protein n=1 Tax=Pseudobutyrivibrio ruminis TaxID=46206 RepID=A0A2G3DT83_9FIRM|nr:hypothetical protein [Pseudobutyrivibrio ruminis]PHU34239.1 hypothetical protein CSX01_11780 [Pseudobutyrivibrio ruminis]
MYKYNIIKKLYKIVFFICVIGCLYKPLDVSAYATFTSGQVKSNNSIELMKLIKINDKAIILSTLGDDYEIDTGILNGEKEYVYYNLGFEYGMVQKLIVSVDPEKEELLDIACYFDGMAVDDTSKLENKIINNYGDYSEKRRSSHRVSGINANGTHFTRHVITYTYVWNVSDEAKLSLNVTDAGVGTWLSRKY